jgi:hypothetical protein
MSPSRQGTDFTEEHADSRQATGGKEISTRRRGGLYFLNAAPHITNNRPLGTENWELVSHTPN